jgi:hypothetical protein
MAIIQPVSVLTEQYVRSKYPYINAWIAFVQSVFPRMLEYSPTSCAQISLLSQATMKTIDYIQQTEPKATVIRVMRLLDDLHTSAWRGWTSFSALSRSSAGTRVLGLQTNALQGLSDFESWDSALNPIPPFHPPTVLNMMLGSAVP